MGTEGMYFINVSFSCIELPLCYLGLVKIMLTTLTKTPRKQIYYGSNMIHILSPSFTKLSRESGVSRGMQNSTHGHPGNPPDGTYPMTLSSSIHGPKSGHVVSIPTNHRLNTRLPLGWAWKEHIFIRCSWVTRPHKTAREIGNCGLATCPKGEKNDVGEEFASFILI